MSKPYLSKKTILPFAITVIASIVITVLFYQQPTNIHPSSTPIIPSVQVITVKAHTQAIPIFSQGKIEPKTQLNLLAQVSGEVNFVSSKLTTGASFNKGDVLYTIEASRIELELKKAKVALQQAILEELKIQAEIEANNNTPPTYNTLAQGKPQLDLAIANKEAAEAVVKLAEQQLKQTQFKAPFDGNVLTASLQNNEQLIMGKPIAHIYEKNTFYIRLPITTEQLSLLDNKHWGNHGIDVNSVLQSETLTASLLRSEGHISPAGMIYLIAELHINNKEKVLPGTLVQARINSKPINNIIAIPNTALRENDTIWLINNNQLHIETVKVLSREKDTVYIQTNTNNELLLVTNSLDYVSNNMHVKVVK
jgi:RND family efflux transporter MFP subunit